ncbi:hypothetical protein GCM10010503_12680 [Streptomyces lucensis JCM 4490]|uniref:Uncharacterized protein n=1 Tax=Streptomyces lucensis JCM 4490 TaxID=1306176 RepID=A0A918MLJ1_9ACTN|nr:hypothetical protein GCM10010503_12680 [Streptomyces lucensis JCM 4490]
MKGSVPPGRAGRKAAYGHSPDRGRAPAAAPYAGPMRGKHALRRLVVADGTVWLWAVRHRHAAGGTCAEVLALYRDGVRTTCSRGPSRAGTPIPGSSSTTAATRSTCTSPVS